MSWLIKNKNKYNYAKFQVLAIFAMFSGLSLTQNEIMSLEARIQTAISLGKIILQEMEAPDFQLTLSRIKNENGWFSDDNVRNALQNIVAGYLDEHALRKWQSNYAFEEPTERKKVGIIAAGNIPAVSFNDLLCVYLSGHIAQLKLSSTDTTLLLWLIEILYRIDSNANQRVFVSERLKDVDALIATGSDNSAKYFDYYFQHVPKIIRKNRSSIAILTGNESKIDLSNLGNDIFFYFGLGCRNVSKVLVPQNYDFTPFFEAIEYWNTILIHHKYNNNYSYNKSVLLVNREEHLDNGFLLVRPSTQLVSPISVLFHETYQSEADLEAILKVHEEKIQCVIGKKDFLPNLQTSLIPFGDAQVPTLLDYADGVDTFAFLLSI